MSPQLKTLTLDINDIDRKTLIEIRRRFLAINLHRISRIRDDAGRNLKRVIDSLPMMIHVNHPTLPGYQSQKTPCAISDYTPTKIQITAAKRISKSFSFEKRARRRRDILSLFMMGSMGTLGQSLKSDLDIWVIHRDGIKPNLLSELKSKLKEIEQWAASLQVSLHFFLMPTDFFEKKNHLEVDNENCGTSQHILLLDEFYRTALLLAGRYPLWWLVPPEYEGEYKKFTSHLIEKRFLRHSDWIDLGGISSIPVEEYFGAALWHLNKAIDAPYKSTLKMMLMEAYAASFPDVIPVCHQFKQQVYLGNVEDDEIDPYVLIYRNIENFLVQQNQNQRLQWVRRCLYLKTRERLSIKPRTQVHQWRRDLMQKLVIQWGWEKELLMALDSRRKWKIKHTLKERKSIIREITQSYRFLSNFATSQPQISAISSEDMSLLGRKLHASFERRADKIEKINQGISPDLSEPELSFVYQENNIGIQSWALIKGQINVREINYHKPIFRHRRLLGIIAWAYINGLINTATKVNVVSENSPVSSQELRALIRILRNHFKRSQDNADVAAFQSNSLPLESLYLINVGEDPMASRKKKGVNLVSERSDPLSYGSARENLIRCVDIISLNSWHEVTFQHFRGTGSLLKLLQHGYESKESNNNWKGLIQCPSGSHAHAIENRLSGLLTQLESLSLKGPPSRFIWQEGRHYQFLGITDQVVEPGMFESEQNLMEVLRVAENEERFIHTFMDDECLKSSPLHLVASHAKPENCHIYFQSEEDVLTIWVADENGALGKGEQHFDNFDSVIRTYTIFLDSISQRKQVHSLNFQPIQYQFLQLNKKGKTWKSSKIPLNQAQSLERFYPVQALLEQGVKDQYQVTIYCGEKLFTEIEFADNLYMETAKYINLQRVNGGRYPVYITDLDLSGLPIEGAQSSLRYLSYKWQLEKKLNDALALLINP